MSVSSVFPRMARLSLAAGFIATLSLAPVSPAAAAGTIYLPPRWTPSPTVTDLGTAAPLAINNSAKVVGRIPASPGGVHAFAWQNNVLTDLGTLPSDVGGSSIALGLNGVGDIAGVSEPPIAGHDWNAVVVRNGAMSELQSRAGAYAINSNGQVAGYTIDSAGIHHAVVFQNGGFQTAPTVTGCTYTEGQAINDNGVMAITGLCSNGHMHASTSQNGVLHDLGGPYNGDSSVTGINLNGLVVGNWTENGYSHGVIWSGGTAYTLSPIAGHYSSSAAAINSNGVAVGYSQDSAGNKHAVLWKNYAVQDLTSQLAAGSGWVLEYATGINDGGQIVGTGLHNGVEHGFLFTPGQVVAIAVAP